MELKQELLFCLATLFKFTPIKAMPSKNMNISTKVRDVATYLILEGEVAIDCKGTTNNKLFS